MKIVHCQQRSSAWFQARCGRVTASEMHRLRQPKRATSQELEARISYRARIAYETVTNTPALDEKEKRYLSGAMVFGNETEPLARAAYEFEYDCSVDLVGFVIHPTIERAGCSPDGIVLDDGGLELKCPDVTTHWGYLKDGVIPEEYLPQMHWNMACTGQKWWDFMSYDPRQVRRLQKFVKRLHRDEAKIAEMEATVRQFLAEVDAEIDIVNRNYPGQEPPPKAKLHIDPSQGISDADIAWWYEQAASNP